MKTLIIIGIIFISITMLRLLVSIYAYSIKNINKVSIYLRIWNIIEAIVQTIVFIILVNYYFTT